MKNQGTQIIADTNVRLQSLIDTYEAAAQAMVARADDEEHPDPTLVEEDVDFARRFTQIHRYLEMYEGILKRYQAADEGWDAFVAKTGAAIDEAIDGVNTAMDTELEQTKQDIDDPKKLIAHAHRIIALEELVERCGFAKEDFIEGYSSDPLRYPGEDVDDIPGLQEVLDTVNVQLKEWSGALIGINTVPPDHVKQVDRIEADAIRIFDEKP